MDIEIIFPASKASKAIGAWVEEVEDEYYKKLYSEMAKWFEQNWREWKGCKFELAECGSEDFGWCNLDVYKDSKYIGTLQFALDSDGSLMVNKVNFGVQDE